MAPLPETPDPHFSEALCGFIQSNLPTLESVEILLHVYRQPDRLWTVDALVQSMQPTVVTRAVVTKHLEAFIARGIVAQDQDGYRYNAASADAPLVEALATAHKERPVSLIRLVYFLRGNKIQSFADAFRMKRD